MRLLFLSLLLLANCSKATAPANSLDEILARKTLRVGLEAGYLPFEMRNKNGDYIGFDVEMAQALAKDLGVGLEIINMGGEGLIPGLLTKKFDLLIAGVTITPERAKTVQFSDPYFTTGLTALMANKHRVAPRQGALRNLSDLNDPKFVITTVAGTTGDIIVKTKLPKAQRRQLENPTDAVNEVRLGHADAFVYDQPFLMILAKKYASQVFALPGTFNHEDFGIALRPSEPELLGRVNQFLARFRQEKKWDALYEKYFVTMEWLGDVNL